MSADVSVAGPVVREGSEEHGRSGPLSRRTFLKAAATAAGGVGLAATLPAAPAAAEGIAIPSTEELREEHANDPAMLIDLTMCVGCGKCVNACKATNDLEWREDQPARGSNAALASTNYSVVQTAPVRGRDNQPRYFRQQCMQCLEPACASACFVKALKKSPEGPVVYDGNMCVGCRYCLVACPFSVPTFEWDRTFGRVSKCQMCYARTSQGEATACSEACLTGAIKFGSRQALLDEAWGRIDSAPAKYVKHVYGEYEAGGTAVMYLSDVPFEQLGFRTGLPTDPLPEYTWQVSRLLPPIAAGLMGTVIALYLRRRNEALEEEDLATEATASKDASERREEGES